MTKIKSVTAPKKETPAKLDKFCICFVPDLESLKVIGGIYLQMKESYPDLISVGTGIGLPYHVTIIGGIKLDPNLSKALIKNAVSQIIPFVDSAKTPKVLTVWPEGKMDMGYLAIGIRFSEGSYVITGNQERNRGLASSLGARGFVFDLTRHVSVCTVRKGFAGFSGKDQVMPLFNNLVERNRQVLTDMTLTPKVFIMPAGKKAWKSYSVN